MMSTTTDGIRIALVFLEGVGGSLIVHISVLRARLPVVSLDGPIWITYLQLVLEAFEQRR